MEPLKTSNLSQGFTLAILFLFVPLISFPDICEAAICNVCTDGDIPIYPLDLQGLCIENHEKTTICGGDEKEKMCAQLKITDLEESITTSKGCNRPSHCLRQKFGLGRSESGCKTITGKDYNKMCPGYPSEVQVSNSNLTDDKPNIQDEWTLEWCVCSKDNCNKGDIGDGGGGNGGGSLLKWSGGTGSGLVIIMMMVILTRVGVLLSKEF